MPATSRWLPEQPIPLRNRYGGPAGRAAPAALDDPHQPASKPYSVHSRESGNPGATRSDSLFCRPWVPAFAGTNGMDRRPV
jgi:hypothetical protein